MSNDDAKDFESRPHRIFDEPHDGIERQDEWSGPYGFLLGGMGDPLKPEIARQYLDAANQLVADIKHQRIADFEVALPILFLYRHAIEMLLKSVLPGGWGHNLETLGNSFSLYIRERFNQDVPEWIESRLKEITEIDPESTSFRYWRMSGRKSASHITPGGEHYISLVNLESGMNELFEALYRVLRLTSR